MRSILSRSCSVSIRRKRETVRVVLVRKRLLRTRLYRKVTRETLQRHRLLSMRIRLLRNPVTSRPQRNAAVLAGRPASAGFFLTCERKKIILIALLTEGQMNTEQEHDERMAAQTRELFIDHIRGLEFDAGWFRMHQIHQTRRHAAAMRDRHPLNAAIAQWLANGQIEHGITQRAYAEYASLAASFPELTVRAAWELAWHNARCHINRARP
ncbi:gp36 [Burkholderia phage BcepB1A]|uniref:gp36 n=1 Tax=Burkholderia phage BcepB1A TaxID=279530 RepID=UPI000053EA60|nr:gp36 [Burkholderia phage BcepB1A]AAT37753.2 gp36 [Burkholderia phage BcepB1A]